MQLQNLGAGEFSAWMVVNSRCGAGRVVGRAWEPLSWYNEGSSLCPAPSNLFSSTSLICQVFCHCRASVLSGGATCPSVSCSEPPLCREGKIWVSSVCLCTGPVPFRRSVPILSTRTGLFDWRGGRGGGVCQAGSEAVGGDVRWWTARHRRAGG